MVAKKSSSVKKPLKSAPKKNLGASLRKIIMEARKEYGKVAPDLEILSYILREGKPEMSPENLHAHFEKKIRCSNFELMDAFGVDKYKVAASTATLVRYGYLKNLGPDSDGATQFILQVVE